MIEGVVTKDLVTHSDERGYFREIIRVTDDFFAGVIERNLQSAGRHVKPVGLKFVDMPTLGHAIHDH